MFKELQVKTVILRGKNYLERKQDIALPDLDEKFVQFVGMRENGKVVVPIGCVGYVCKQLVLQGIDVRMSSVLYPKQASDVVRNSLKGKRN